MKHWFQADELLHAVHVATGVDTTGAFGVRLHGPAHAPTTLEVFRFSEETARLVVVTHVRDGARYVEAH